MELILKTDGDDNMETLFVVGHSGRCFRLCRKENPR